MTAWGWILIGLAAAGLIVFYGGLMEASARSSRLEEQEYLRLHPPDRKDDAAASRRMDNDTSSERCVCCGEIIPEGRQVCSSCEEKRREGTNAWL